MFYILWFSYFSIALKAELEILSDKGFVALNSGNFEFLTAVKKYIYIYIKRLNFVSSSIRMTWFCQRVKV